MSHGKLRRQAGCDDRLWPVLLLLVFVVLVPTAALTWLVGRAARNESLVARQKLLDAYAALLPQAQRELRAFFASRLERGERHAGEFPAADAAPAAIGDLADAVVRFDEQGRLIQPRPLPPLGDDPLSRSEPWQAAQQAEFRHRRYREAAEAYAEIAAASEHPNVVGRALLAQARCLEKSGDVEAAILGLRRIVESPLGPYARDAQQRLVAADAGIRALELMQAHQTAGAELDSVRRRLLHLITSEHAALTPSAQRRFVGRRIRDLFPDEGELTWLAGEELAARYAAVHSAPPQSGSLQPTSLPAVWQITSRERRVVLLFREATLRRELAALLERTAETPHAGVVLLPPGAEPRVGPEHLAVAPAGPMAGWQLALTGGPTRASATTADRQVALYGWTAIVAVGAVAVAACGLGSAVGRQRRLRRLQSDWLATVSHELKTPLASIHLLTDSLLEGEGDPADYLRMISTEATRLTGLIDRLLLSSRLNGGAARLDRQPVRPEEIVAAAVAALGERLRAPGCEFTQHVSADLPLLLADRDALAMLLVNLLENAWKFTGSDKRISLHVSRDDSRVCFRVADNGIGLSAGDARRVFDRFFQADCRLAREQGGCGLGLSIVQQLAEAHGGTVSVHSEPGRGSIFTVCLPALVAAHARETHHTQ